MDMRDLGVTFYDREGNPIDSMERVERLLGDPDYKIVRQTPLGDLMVSTVWLGLDHGWGLPFPLIFESMVFDRGAGEDMWQGLDEDMERYATEAQALEGHRRLVEKYTALLDVDHAVRNLTETES